MVNYFSSQRTSCYIIKNIGIQLVRSREYMPPNVSPDTILKLKKIFDDLNWDTQIDPAFKRFSQTLEFLSAEQQELVLELTKKFLKIDIGKYIVHLKQALEKIDKNVLAGIDTVYVVPLIAKKDLGKSKSSTMVARFIVGRELSAKNILGVKNLVLIDRLSTEKMPSDENWLFMLVDDFIGTGETATEAINEFLADFGVDKNKILVLSIVAQEIGLNKVLDLGVTVICSEVRKKGISDEIASPQKESYINIMSSIESILRVRKKFRLGYKASEALVTLDRTPNNTFPVYWLETNIQGKRFIAPFPRD